ncbi:MAG: glycosyltransferase family 39 protein [Chloroflexota bacterium]|nr:glycosyltransferase family 39 protein [Chloroflexota bacterium]
MAAMMESDNRVGTRRAGSRVALAWALAARYALPLTLLLALVVRVALIVRAPGVLDGDEALVGIQAESIAAGAARPLPVYFYGQHYMGALEAYLAAGVFRLVGPSVVALRLVPLAFALLLVLLTYELARRVVGRQAALVAALLAALAPLYPAVWSLKARGGYVETLVFGSALLIVTHRLLYGPHDGLGLRALPPARPARFVGLTRLRQRLAPRGGGATRPYGWLLLWGLLAGLAFWTNPVSLYYIVTGAGAFAVAALRRHGWRVWRPETRQRLGRAALPSLIPLVLGVIVGGLPLWVDNIFYARGATFAYLLAPSGGVGATLSRAPRVVVFFIDSIIPKLTGAWEPWGAPANVVLGLLVLALYALSAAYLLLRLAAGRRGVLGYRGRPRHGQGLLLTFALVVAVVFCLSSFGGAALNPQFDAASRYALPLLSVLPVAAGALVWRLWRAWAPLGAVALIVLLLASGVSYVTARPNTVFQSEYWDKLPPSEAPLARFLADHNIHSVWINHWAGYPLMFAADAYAPGRLAAFDYNDVTLHGGVDRLPWAHDQVMRDPHAAFVLVTQQAHPPLETLLTAQGITFRRARVGVGPYLVYWDLSHRVDPYSVRGGLGFSY